MARPAGNEQLDRLIKRRGWTRRDVADAVNRAYERITGRPGAYDEERIRRLVRGEITWPHPAYRQALEVVFGARAAELGLFNSRNETRPRQSRHTPKLRTRSTGRLRN